MTDKKYYIPDIESGQVYEASKEAYESYLKMWECSLPITNPRIGVPIIYGTGGECSNNAELEKIFKQEEYE